MEVQDQWMEDFSGIKELDWKDQRLSCRPLFVQLAQNKNLSHWPKASWPSLLLSRVCNLCYNLWWLSPPSPKLGILYLSLWLLQRCYSPVRHLYGINASVRCYRACESGKNITSCCFNQCLHLWLCNLKGLIFEDTLRPTVKQHTVLIQSWSAHVFPTGSGHRLLLSG